MKSRLNTIKILALAPAFLLTGCASVMNGTHQSVSVVTPPARNATCVLTNNKGTWYANHTPSSVTVHRSGYALKVTCRKHGYRVAHKSVKSQMQGAIAGNAIVGGLIGAGVDAADGAAFGYPNPIVVPMRKKHA